MKDGVLAQLAALKDAPTPALKERWRELFGKEPPPYNRDFLQSRLSYRIQELAYGGLKRETSERLRAIAKEEEKSAKGGRRQKGTSRDRPLAGTRLIRQWKGIEHQVTVLADGFEYLGHPYQSLSVIAREITGTRWNGWVFFGLKNQRAAQ
jgi:hypothetical protein